MSVAGGEREGSKAGSRKRRGEEGEEDENSVAEDGTVWGGRRRWEKECSGKGAGRTRKGMMWTWRITIVEGI